MTDRQRFSHGLFLLRVGCLLILVMPMLGGCAPSRITGHLGLVTRNTVDSTVLLKSGQHYREVGPVAGSVCYDPRETTSPTDNFSKVAEQAMNSVGEADALIDVTVTTHRANYFAVWLPVPVIMAVAVAVYPESSCTSLSGTAIKFSEPPNCAPCVVARKPLRTWIQAKDLTGDSSRGAVATTQQPAIEWEPFPGPSAGVTYELTIWRAKVGWSRAWHGAIVYERQGLTGSAHQVETALESSTQYLWAVRAHFVALDGQIHATPWGHEAPSESSDGTLYNEFWTPDPVWPAQ